MINLITIFNLLYFLNVPAPGGDSLKPYESHCISKEEMILYTLINQYRVQHHLKEIPLSKSLSFVARTHMIDLFENVGEMTHSWSTCNYRSGVQKTYPCMWLKPSELTSYDSYGYECVMAISFGDVNAATALDTWENSTPHNNVILNKSIWKDITWEALGVGIYKGYAAIWFGEKTDAADIPLVCD